MPPATELEPSGCNVDRPPELSAFSAAPVQGCDGIAGAREIAAPLRSVFRSKDTRQSCEPVATINEPPAIGVGFFVRGDANLPGHPLQRDEFTEYVGGFGAGCSGSSVDPRR